MINELVSIYGARLLCFQAESWNESKLAAEIVRIPPGFDCFIVNREKGFDEKNNVLIETIVSRAGKWIEVFGEAAEEIHDAVDAASVRVGRQRKMGDGDPMTTWQDNSSDTEVASYLWTGGQGDSSTKVLVVIGPPQLAENMRRALLEHRR